MKTAIIISGEMRTFATCVHTQRWHVFRHYPEADFYISTVATPQVDSIKELRKLYPSARIEVDVCEKQPDLLEPAEPVRFEPYGRSVPVQAVLRQLWQLDQAWKLVLRFNREYRQVLRVRPDSYFHSYEPVRGVGGGIAYTPWWGRFGGVNDRFAVLGYGAAEKYFTTHSRIPLLMADGCPLHPESLVKASMTLGGCDVYDTLKAEFSTLKLDGQRPPEISPIDLAHAGMG